MSSLALAGLGFSAAARSLPPGAVRCDLDHADSITDLRIQFADLAAFAAFQAEEPGHTGKALHGLDGWLEELAGARVVRPPDGSLAHRRGP